MMDIAGIATVAAARGAGIHGTALNLNSDSEDLLLLTAAACASRASRQYLVKGLIARGDVCLIIGPPGAGKSALGPYLAHAVSQGRRILARRVRQGCVLYVPAEDTFGMRARIQALLRRYGRADDFFILEGIRDLYSDIGQSDILLEVINDKNPSLVIIDTIAAAFPGMNENDSQGMGAVTKLARTMSRGNGTNPGPAVVLIHHVPKGDETTPRGHGILNGDADLVLRLSRPARSNEVSISLGKNRNGPSSSAPMSFRIEAEQLGTDEDGDAITAPVVVECKAAEEVGVGLTPLQTKALELLRKSISEHGTLVPADAAGGKGQRGLSKAAWRQHFEDMGLSKAARSVDRAKVFRDTTHQLVEKGLIAVNENSVWLLDGNRHGMRDDP